MLLTITITHQPATDLGYLLHKHPDRCQTFKLPFGVARVFYTEATEERCTAALVIDMDAIDLNRRRARGFGWEQYVNDRPYVASSFSALRSPGFLGRPSRERVRSGRIWLNSLSLCTPRSALCPVGVVSI